MATRVTETERKYEPTQAGRLAGVPGLEGGEETVLDAVYHDTADLRLARRGVTLRRRTGGADEGWHLKLPMGGDTREEIHARDAKQKAAKRDADVKRVPEELAELVRGMTRGEPLAPVAHVRTKRRRWELRDGEGRLAAEIVEDDVAAQTLGHTAVVKAWREIEVELVEGGDEVFEAVERRLGKPSEVPSKLARVLGDRLPGKEKPAKGITGHVRRQVAEMGRQDVRIRRDGEDAVHRMRVASRRIRSVLQAYKGNRRVIKELRWLGAVLAPARDLEVLREHLEAQVGELPSELVLGNVRQRLTETFAPREQRARAEVRRTLNSKRYFALLDRLDALEVRPAHKKRRLRKTERRVWGRQTLHDVRKAAKRARYAAEAAGKPKLARRMKKLQKTLGVHQDSVVARQELRTMGVQSHLDGDNGFTYGLLYGCELRRAERVEESLPRKRKV
ncbi:CHAD domain-containing protein [Kutzneria sp. NPDC052558]|uniref:CYTH and CHAD domain-containing protein n=1 Tax=Kutzneria sp. NPDC052558 TaxID=3364121 RepID=UPI0037C55D0B